MNDCTVGILLTNTSVMNQPYSCNVPCIYLLLHDSVWFGSSVCVRETAWLRFRSFRLFSGLPGCHTDFPNGGHVWVLLLQRLQQRSLCVRMQRKGGSGLIRPFCTAHVLQWRCFEVQVYLLTSQHLSGLLVLCGDWWPNKPLKALKCNWVVLVSCSHSNAVAPILLFNRFLSISWRTTSLKGVIWVVSSTCCYGNMQLYGTFFCLYSYWKRAVLSQLLATPSCWKQPLRQSLPTLLTCDA